MNILAPHSIMNECRRIAIYIDKDNKWYPARDYQEAAIKDFIEVINLFAESYKKMYDNNIEINKFLTKKYNPLPNVFFNLSFNILSNDDDFTIIIDTFNQNDFDFDNIFESHLAIVYHTWDSLEHFCKRKPIKSMGFISQELKEIIKSHKN